MSDTKIVDEQVKVDPIDLKINENKELVDQLSEEIKGKIKKEQKQKDVYIERLKTGIELLDWTKKKFNLMFGSSPNNVFKRDVFYCNLGKNVGSEQGGRRPVVIIQNDNGNRNSSTTMVAVITTHERSIKVIEDEKGIEKLVKYDKKGEIEWSRKLKYYEIPVKLEPGANNIEGIINMTQIVTVSKKRLAMRYSGKVTNDTSKKIEIALKRMFDIRN